MFLADGFEDIEALGTRDILDRGGIEVITGRGPGHAIDFAIEILRMLRGEALARSVTSGAILPCE